MWREMDMGRLNKFFFWFFLIVLSLMPYGIVMTFAILLLYYGVPYIKSEFRDLCDDCDDTVDVYEYKTRVKSKKKSKKIDEFSDDTLEEMR